MSNPRFASRCFRMGAALAVGHVVAAHANVGLPILAAVWPVSWALLPLIILLEAFVARGGLRSSWPKSLTISGAANLTSTILGIPATGLAIIAFELVFGKGAPAIVAPHPTTVLGWLMAPFYVLWLPPLADSQRWLPPLISAGLCVPLFFASVWVEKMVALRFSGLTSESVRSWAWRANLLSYGLLVAGLLVMAVMARS